MESNRGDLPAILSSIPSGTATAIATTLTSSSTFVTTKSQPGKRRPHLVLHFDINETILVGDDAGGDTREDCLNKILAKVAFVQIPSKKTVETVDLTAWDDTTKICPERWWDGSPISKLSNCEAISGSGAESGLSPTHSPSPTSPTSTAPPLYVGWQWPKDTCPYYRTSFKNRARTFTQHDGAMYRPLYHIMNERLSSKTGTTDRYTNILPSFFHTLATLQKNKQPYTLVLRTFGSDLGDIAESLTEFATGGHPDYPTFREPNLILRKENLLRGRWRVRNDDESEEGGDDAAVYDLLSSDPTSLTPIASGDKEVADLIESRTVLGIRDDYEFWAANGHAPRAGKPVWVGKRAVYDGDDGTDADDTGKPRKREYHHIFFDDNIHNSPSDGIVAVRAFDATKGGFRSVSGEEGLCYHRTHIVRVPTVSAILEDDWFLKRITEALDDGGCT